MKLHQDLTLDRITDAVERRFHSLDDPGFCIACGAEVDGVEPDAERYRCEVCGNMAVYGAEELLIYLV